MSTTAYPYPGGSHNDNNRYFQMRKYYDSSFPTHGDDGRFIMLVMRQHYRARWSLRMRAKWELQRSEYLTQDGRPVTVLNDEKGEFQIAGEKEVLRLG